MYKEIPIVLTRLSNLLDTPDTKCQGVYLQAEPNNTGQIKFGRHGHVDFFLDPGKSATYLTNDARNLYVIAAGAGDFLSFDTLQE